MDWLRTWPGVNRHLIHALNAKVLTQGLQLLVGLEEGLAELIKVIVNDGHLHSFHLSQIESQDNQIGFHKNVG